jgi:hypothetical protein
VETGEQSFRQIRILLQPNYLPVHLRMFVKWSKAEALEQLEANLLLPTLETIGSNQVSLALKTTRPARVQIKTAMGTKGKSEPGAARGAFVPMTDATQVAADTATRWKNLLLKSLPTVSDLNSDELASWLESWSPRVVRLKGEQRFPISDAADTDKRQYENVAQFWNWYLEQLDAGDGDLLNSLSAFAETEPEVANDSPLLHSDFEPSAQYYAPEFDRGEGVTQYLSVQGLPNETISKPRLSAAALLCLASGLGFWLILRLSKLTLEILSLRPWLYWAFLAMLAWLILPAVWPSLVIAGSAISLFVSQFFSSQRRSYAGRTA